MTRLPPGSPPRHAPSTVLRRDRALLPRPPPPPALPRARPLLPRPRGGHEPLELRAIRWAGEVERRRRMARQPRRHDPRVVDLVRAQRRRRPGPVAAAERGRRPRRDVVEVAERPPVDHPAADEPEAV